MCFSLGFRDITDFTQQEVETDFTKLLKEVAKSELRIYRVVVNKFYELELVYADHYKKVLGTKSMAYRSSVTMQQRR